MLIACVSLSAGATERERKDEKKEGRRRGKGRVKAKREEEEGKEPPAQRSNPGAQLLPENNSERRRHVEST